MDFFRHIHTSWTTSSPTKRALLTCLLLGGITLATFWPVTRHDFIYYDDPDYVTENPYVQAGLNWKSVVWAFSTGHSGNWHPVTWLSHMLDCQVFGLKPGYHHLMNLFFHTANTVLLFLVLERMTAAFWRSAFVATLFALHPLHVESVAWVAERKDVLSAFFGMLTLWAYARYCEESKVRGPRAKVFYAFALLLFALGLMSKPMLVTWPFVLLLLDSWPLRRLRHEPGARLGRDFLRLAWEKVPFFCLVAISSIVTFLVQERKGYVFSIGGLPLGARLVNAVASYLKYLGKMIWPTDLAIFYPHPEIRHPASDQWPVWQILAAALLLALISAFSLLRLKRQPWLVTGWFWYLGTLVPVIGIVQVGNQAMADRYSYIPLIGVFICLVWGIAEVLANRRLGQAVLGAMGVAVTITCVAITRQQMSHWRDGIAVHEHALAVTTNNHVAHFNLGADLARQGKYEAAIAHYQAALQAYPSYPDAHFSMAVALTARGRLEEAAEQYRGVLRLTPGNALARNNLGVVLSKLGKPDEALLQYVAAVRFKPDYAAAHYNIGGVFYGRSRFADAAAAFAEAVRLKPDYHQARTGLGMALAGQGKLGEAETQLRDVVRQIPMDTEAQLNLGNLLMKSGQTEEAKTCFSNARQLALEKLGEVQTQLRMIVRLRPADAQAHINLGNLLTELGETEEAKACFSNALRLEPDAVENNLREGKLLVAQGNVAAAIARFTTAVRLKEDTAEAHEHLGLLRIQQGRFDEAVADFKQLLQLRPDAQANHHLGLALAMQGKSEDALIYYTQAVRLKPDWPEALNDLAWILATHPQAKIRNGPEAVRLAKRASELSGGKVARFWATLDAAYAEAGRFADAVNAAEKARELALAADEKDIAQAAEERLILYRKRQPYRQQADKTAQ